MDFKIAGVVQFIFSPWTLALSPPPSPLRPSFQQHNTISIRGTPVLFLPLPQEISRLWGCTLDVYKTRGPRVWECVREKLKCLCCEQTRRRYRCPAGRLLPLLMYTSNAFRCDTRRNKDPLTKTRNHAWPCSAPLQRHSSWPIWILTCCFAVKVTRDCADDVLLRPKLFFCCCRLPPLH